MDSTITSLEQLEALYSTPQPTSLKKQSDELTAAYRRWIEHSCFFVIASSNTNEVDCTPRGDGLGQAFRISDSKTIVIPDRRGNNRLETLRNIIQNPNVALLFFIPGVEQTVRVMGKASISTSQALLEQFELDNRYPLSCISVAIDTVYFQNARAMARSALWKTVNPDILATVPTPEEMLQDL